MDMRAQNGDDFLVELPNDDRSLRQKKVLDLPLIDLGPFYPPGALIQTSTKNPISHGVLPIRFINMTKAPSFPVTGSISANTICLNLCKKGDRLSDQEYLQRGVGS